MRIAVVSTPRAGNTWVRHLLGAAYRLPHLARHAMADADWAALPPEVVLPLISPAIFFNVIVGIIGSFKVFTPAKVITNGGPGSGTTATVAFLVLQTGFDANHQGYASAIAVVMLIIVAAATAVVLKVLQKREVDL